MKKIPVSNLGLSRFIKKRDACLSCNSLMNKQGAVCDLCKSKESEIYQKLICEQSALEEKFSKLWTQCQSCQSSLHENVICSNKDCQIFYRRIKVQKDLNEQVSIMARFPSW